MGWRGTFFLALVAGVLGAYVWFEQPPARDDAGGADIIEARPREPTQPVQPLLTFTPANVAAVRLERDGQVVESERHGEQWQVTDPPGAIEDFLRNLTQLGVLSEIPGSTDLNEYGLQPPHAMLQLRLRTQSTLLVQIGDRNPATTGVYVRVDDGPVLLAGALVEWEFDKLFKALAPPHTLR